MCLTSYTLPPTPPPPPPPAISAISDLISAVNGNVREEMVTSKTSKEILELINKLTNQSGLDIIRIRKPFHTDCPSIQGQWHPFTNRAPSIGPIRPLP